MASRRLAAAPPGSVGTAKGATIGKEDDGGEGNGLDWWRGRVGIDSDSKSAVG